MRKLGILSAMFLLGGVGLTNVPGDEETVLLEPVIFMVLD